MKNRGKYLYSTVFLIALLGFSGCTSTLKVAAGTDGSADMEFTSSMGTALSDTIKAITGKMEGNSSRGIFSEDSIRRTLADSDFSAVKVSTGKDSSLSAGGKLPPAEKQTHATGTLRAADFIYTSSSKMTLTVTPENLFTMAQGLPEDTKSYLELFMAPVFSGEKMTKDEYRMLIASIYGENIAKELESSAIDVTLIPPKGKSIKKSSPANAESSASKAVFSIPLLDFLTLGTQKSYSIEW
ncbi:MAG: hypothetical protein J5930_00820 [Treponema sp.]|nr:hypothetical protein [Treponema sp.]